MSTKERGVLFNDQMVKALIAGRKWQTRRMVNFRDSAFSFPHTAYRSAWAHPGGGWTFSDLSRKPDDWVAACERGFPCPYPVGTRLWVKEGVWCNDPAIPRGKNGGALWPKLDRESGLNWFDSNCQYTADWPTDALTSVPQGSRCLNKMFMPRWASRINRVVTAVRVQRLQDISEDDAQAEGVQLPVSQHGNPLIDMGEHTPLQFIDDAITGEARLRAAWTHRMNYALLWESINGKGSWAANPWVWAYSLGQVKP
jgi:hypothetical protein